MPVTTASPLPRAQGGASAHAAAGHLADSQDYLEP